MNNSRRNLLLLFAGTFAANTVHAKWTCDRDTWD